MSGFVMILTLKMTLVTGLLLTANIYSSLVRTWPNRKGYYPVEMSMATKYCVNRNFLWEKLLTGVISETQFAW